MARACYKDDRLAKLIPPEGLTPEEVAAAGVPVDDRIWALCYAAGLDSKSLRLFSCRTARRALAHIANPDPLSIAAVDTAERFARGEATKEELGVARKQAYAVSVYDAHYSAYASAYCAAHYSAASAYYAADYAAFYAAFYDASDGADYAARQAERKLQLQDLLSCFKTEQGEINEQKTEVRLLPGQAVI